MGAESLPIHMMSGPDLIARAVRRRRTRSCAAATPSCTTSPTTATPIPADHSMFVPVDRRRGRAPLLGAREGAPGRLRQLAADDLHGRGRATSTRRARCCSTPAASSSDYADNEDILRMCQLRIRVPEQWWGDYLALLGAVRVGERRMLELGRRARLGRARRRSSATGSTTASTVMRRRDRGAPVAGRVEVDQPPRPVPRRARRGRGQGGDRGADRDEGRIEVDLRDNVDCLPNGLNLTESTARTARDGRASSTASAPASRRTPAASAASRSLLRENCAVGIPRHPASCSTATTNLADRVANAVQRGLVRARRRASGSPRSAASSRRRPASSRAAIRARRRAVRQPDLHGHHRRRGHARGPTAG